MLVSGNGIEGAVDLKTRRKEVEERLFTLEWSDTQGETQNDTVVATNMQEAMEVEQEFQALNENEIVEFYRDGCFEVTAFAGRGDEVYDYVLVRRQ